MNCLETTHILDFIEELEQSQCKKCQLHNMVATQVVISRGSLTAKIMIVGQNPGADEDRLGSPFVGKSGQLLDKMFEAIHLHTNKDCYLTNACLCWTPSNTNPAEYPGVLDTCRPYLIKQLELLKPAIIVAVGKPSFESLTQRKCGAWLGHTCGNISRAWGPERDGPADRYPIFPIMHPAYLLRNEAEKPTAWEHMKKLSIIIEEMNLINGFKGVHV